MTTVLRAREPRDLLSYVPFRLGFPPRESLVMISLAATSGRVGLVARQDLPPAWSATGPIARVLAALAVRDGADAVVLVVYRSGAVPARVVATLTFAFRVAGVRVQDVFQVDDDRYRCLTCSRACCPPEGRPVSDLESSLVGAEMVLAGNAVVADRAALVGELGPLEGQDGEVARELDSAEEWWGGARPRPHRRTEALQVWDAALRKALAEDEAPLSARDTARLVTALRDVAVRDALILRTVPGGEAAAPALLRGAGEGTAVRVALDAAFGSGGTSRPAEAPDPHLVQAADRLLRHLVRAVDDERRAGPLAVLAWLAWWRGDGALADQLVDRLLAVAPMHSLGVLLRAAVDQCVPPPWVGGGREGVRAPA